ncbi:hypothetical protein [Actinomadura roseirufa]|uniref:hypothetical protein n=1 Tax=Actinomadura roseirufa TaxID=2094049 RepID=UPI00104109AC|nr:hypothetical protein [Actinomadura roseirufa]
MTALGIAGLVLPLPLSSAAASPPGPHRSPSFKSPSFKSPDLKSPDFKRGVVFTGDRAVLGRSFGKPRAAAGDHVIKLDLIDRSGRAPGTAEAPRVYIWPLDGGDPTGADIVGGHGEEKIPTGDYAMYGYVKTHETGGETSMTLVYLPKVHVDGTTSVVLDARAAKPIRASVDRAGARANNTAVLVSQKLGNAEQPTAMDLSGKNLYITPVPRGLGVTFHVQSVLTRGGAVTGSPYVFNLASSAEGIPSDPGVHARERDLAAVRTRHNSEGGPGCAAAHALVDFGIGVQVGLASSPGALPVTRSEYFSPGVAWGLREAVSTADCAFTDFDVSYRDERFPRAGSYSRQWNNAPFGPAGGVLDLSREGDVTFEAQMAAAVDVPVSWESLRGDSMLRDAEGTLVGVSAVPGEGTSWPSPAPGKHTLTVDAERAVPWSDLSTRQHVVWDLDIKGNEVIKLPAVRYRTSLDDANRARPGSRQEVSLVPEGLPAGTRPVFSVSYDDGTTWRRVPVSASGTASFTNPSSGHVSLRTQVPGVLDQTVIHAYGVR